MDTARRSNFSPTDTVPGSEERLRVMEQRYAASQPLFHPLDRKDDITKAIAGWEAGNGVVMKTTRAVDIREHVQGPSKLGQPKNFSSILIVFRKKSGMSQRQLAVRAGVSRNTIQNLESGIHEPSLSLAALIMRELGCPLCAGEEQVA